MQVNTHYLRLFHYVAKHGGISQAVRHVPYGIQQPALSSQMMELEDQLGTVLFQRRPFKLTPAGEKLYEHGKVFFDDLDKVTDELRNGAPDLIRIGASPVVLEDYLPEIFRTVEQRFPRLNFNLHAGLHDEIEKMMQMNEVDLAVCVLEGKPPPHCAVESLIKLPLVLLVPPGAPVQSADELWAQDRIAHKLIAPSDGDALSRLFRRELAKRSLYWNTAFKFNSVDMIETYTAKGFGIGLSVSIPGRVRRLPVRELPLHGFDTLDFSMTWRRHPNSVTLALMDELRKKAAEAAKWLPASVAPRSVARQRSNAPPSSGGSDRPKSRQRLSP
jgi:DNA-binding transcriptional LysR family regulator